MRSSALKIDEDCEKIIRFYENRTSGALVKPMEDKIIFYGWEESLRKDVKLEIYVANSKVV